MIDPGAPEPFEYGPHSGPVLGRGPGQQLTEDHGALERHRHALRPDRSGRMRGITGLRLQAPPRVSHHRVAAASRGSRRITDS